MKTKFENWVKVLGLGCAMSLLAACNDPNEPMGKGDVEFEITDAPTDDAAIKGVIVTIADVKVDGHSVSGFSKQTIDLKAYQEGNTKLLASAQQLDAKTYSSLTLVLDLNADANGNVPGCYVLTQDNMKYKLKSTTSGTTDVNISKSWSVASNTKTNVVMDFDLRKTIAYSDDPAVRYSFVNDNSLGAAIRVVTKSKAGTIKGSYKEDQSSNADKVIVYAYKESTFNASTETQGQGNDKVFFANAVASAEVKSGLTGNTYTLALLEEGEYEIYFAAHTENVQTGRITFQAMLQSETTANGSIANLITVQGGATINISTTIKGIL